MMKNILTVLFSVILLGNVIESCSEDGKASADYPAEIEEIIHTSCSGASCHIGLSDNHQKSLYDEAGGGLDLTNWETLFEGSHYGSVVIPFSSKFSHIMKHLTGEQDLMPPLGMLPQQQIDVIRQWIDDGAPSRDGRIPFSNAESRIFTTNQDSDVVAVVDEKSLLAMRVFPVGLNVAFESPHGLQISPDGRYFYVSMIVGQTVLKFEASNGLFVDSVNLGKPLALIKLSSDGSKLYVTTNFDINNPAATSGQVTIIRTADMTTIKQIGIGINPHGINLSRDGILLYVTAVNSDEIYVIDTRSDTVITSFTADSDPSPDPDFEPYHVALSQKNADGYEDYIFVTCRKDGKMRIFQRESNTVTSQHSFSLIGSIPVGLSSLSKPIQMDVTPDGNKLYTANYGDNTVSVIIRSGLSYAFERNISTRVLDGDTLRLSGPNGVSVSRDGRYVYVTNRNRTGGVPGHHGGTGGGFVSVIEVMTDQLIKTIELPPDAYSVITYP